MHPVGFEPTRLPSSELKSDALDHSATDAYLSFLFFFLFYISSFIYFYLFLSYYYIFILKKIFLIYLLYIIIYIIKQILKIGSTQIRTGVAGFKVPNANQLHHRTFLFLSLFPPFIYLLFIYFLNSKCNIIN